MSSRRVGPVGCQPSSSRVLVLVAAMSMLKKRPIHPKCASTSLAATETVGRPRKPPIAAAMSREGMPSSPTACIREPAGAFSSARRTMLAAAVHGGPAARSVAGVACGAFLLRDLRQGRGEAVVAHAMHGRCEAQCDGAHALVGVVQGEVLAAAAHRVDAVEGRRV